MTIGIEIAHELRRQEIEETGTCLHIVKRNSRLGRSGHRNIHYCKERNNYKVALRLKGVRYQKRFQTLEDAIAYRDKLHEEILHPYLRERQGLVYKGGSFCEN